MAQLDRQAHARAVQQLASRLAQHSAEGCADCDRYVAAVMAGRCPSVVLDLRCDRGYSWQTELRELLEAAS